MNTLLQQYQQIKTKYPDAVLLFRVGDFYETFNEDAEIISAALGITLVESKSSEQLKLSASIPFHTLDNALRRLVQKGHKVAICEELKDPKPACETPK